MKSIKKIISALLLGAFAGSALASEPAVSVENVVSSSSYGKKCAIALGVTAVAGAAVCGLYKWLKQPELTPEERAQKRQERKRFLQDQRQAKKVEREMRNSEYRESLILKFDQKRKEREQKKVKREQEKEQRRLALEQQKKEIRELEQRAQEGNLMARLKLFWRSIWSD